MAPAHTIIRNGLLVDAPGHRVDPRDILVAGDRIAEIGPPGMDAPPLAVVVDATNRLMMPGLINAHTHSHANLPRSPGDRWTLELALHLNPSVRGNQTLEDKYLSAQLGAVEMLSKGCTACYDLFYEFPQPSHDGLHAVAQAYSDVGIRAVVAPMMASQSFYRAIPGLLEALPDAARERLGRGGPPADGQGLLDDARRTLHGWHFDRDRVRMAVAPTIPLHCSDRFWQGAAGLARDYGVGLHTHLAESKVQAVAGMKRYGRTLTAHLDRLGVLGPGFTGAHGVWLDDEDMRRLEGAGAAVAHNPASNMRYGSGLAAVRRMVEQGLTVGIGTDSRSCSDNLNMFEAMRLASYTSRVRGPDYERWLTSDEVFRMATEGSARALGFAGELGRIAPGYKADIVFLDRRNLNYVPLNDVTVQIVNAEDGTGVAEVMVGGRMVVSGGRVTTVDVDRLIDRCEAAMERLRAANGEAHQMARALEKVVGSFCAAMGAEPYHVHRFVDDHEHPHPH
ncbi:cytosine/adenosine deaminase-related metal-dependent hydrolase [Stella humosa]|uniref:Cytosine/adenosine deaminase-related metal-dependent hydrolase n=1 Tax=Stella humosa TaxID=94 RepID=A0A3N1L7Y6_9PROT|nr:amidohydrolase family protein [Stella humosa]ROP90783.1 cytosine/adenosine deaminase-related metal-dependent hydrolase [Stella humosa]BBK34871.1 hydroxyatrazine ethylaminohydrolase [Stella humosa]